MKNAKRLKKADVGKLILSLVLLIIAILWILPLVMTVLTSFKSTLEVKKFVKLIGIFQKSCSPFFGNYCTRWTAKI